MSIIPFILSIAAIAAYLAQWRRIDGRGFVFAGAALHLAALAGWLYATPRLQLATLLSLFMLMTLAICWRSLVFAAMRRVLIGAAALAVAAPLVLPATAAAAFSLHSVLALAVYALAAAAFLLCLDLRLAEGQLRRQPHEGSAPSLLAHERRYFRYVLLSFVLLTLTLASGIAAALAAGEPLFAWTHKQLFAYLTWLVFLVLLTGRRVAGWRGAAAQRWFFAGYAFLLLSYIGSTVGRQLILAGG